MSDGILGSDAEIVGLAGQARGSVATKASHRRAAVCARLLAAIDETQREAVESVLQQTDYRSFGLWRWVDAIATQEAVPPERIPRAVIDVYLEDPEAEPLYECGTCGLAVPVRPNRLLGPDAEPDKIYFRECPACGGETGYYSYRTTIAATSPAPTKPR